MPMLSVLGPVEVPGARVDRPQQRAVLAYLLLRAGEQISSTQLIDAVWADHAPSSARTQIHSSDLDAAAEAGRQRRAGAHRQ